MATVIGARNDVESARSPSLLFQSNAPKGSALLHLGGRANYSGIKDSVWAATAGFMGVLFEKNGDS